MPVSAGLWITSTLMHSTCCRAFCLARAALCPLPISSTLTSPLCLCRHVAAAGNLLWRVSLLNLGELPPLELVNSKPAAGVKDTGSLLFLPMENGVVKVVATKTGIISRCEREGP